jgi:hypothetical protein
VTSVAKREMKAMQAAGWTVVSCGPWERLRALLAGRRPVPGEVRSETEVVARVHLPRPAEASLQGWSR